MTDLQSFLDTVSAQSAAQGTRLYALVDHAGAPGLLDRLHERPQTHWLNVFTASREGASLDAAPLLLDLETISQKPWLQWLHFACGESTSLALLHSSLELPDLAECLKRRLDVLLPDAVPALLRYFDTRIIESLLQVLETEQRKKFFGITACWQWLDRAGELRHHPVEQLPDDSWPSPWKLDEKQQNAMIDAAEADAVMQQMQNHGMELCAGRSRASLHALARSCIAQAAQFGIEGIPARTLFSLLALQIGTGFHEQAEWAALLARVRRREISFEDAIRLKTHSDGNNDQPQVHLQGKNQCA